jgi:1-acyl-sn-glycerol-3-phosphate acyltransferase
MHAGLLATRRFGPLFFTQFLGAFNDNLFKNALVILVTFRAVTVAGLPPEQMVALSGALFILPFFLFSATAGQLADKYDKATLIRWTKNAEIAVMLAGAGAFLSGNVPVLLAILFLMGLQSTFFGPLKYSVLPQHLPDEELVTGNALVEMGTYLAILGGTIAGGVLIARDGGELVVAAGVVLMALLGRAAAQGIPAAPPASPDLKLRWDPIFPTLELIRLCRRDRASWLSILGISWFWAFGALFLSLFPTWTEGTLSGNEQLATLFLALFSVGIGVGSMLCERFSRERLELGLVPIGAFGMSVFTLDLAWIGQPWPATAEPMGLTAFLATFAGVRIAADLLLLAISGGFMIVPLYTLIQQRAADSERSRIIAGNNIINSALMVGASVALMGLYAAGLTPPQIMGLLAAVNVLVAAYMYTRIPEFVLRFLVWVLSRLVYRVQEEGLANIPKEGPAILVCNHVSFIDWLILAGAVRRPARFVMYKAYYQMPLLNWLFAQARAIPIASSKEDPDIVQRAFDAMSAELRAGELVCIFPEGRITETGEMNKFLPGVERMVGRDPVPVIPMALNGLWGSYFSRRDGPAMSKPFRRRWSRVWVTVGEAVPPEEVTAAGLQARVQALYDRRKDAP